MRKMLTPQEIAMLRALKGQICVFREKSIICTVIVAEVTVDASAARFTLQPAPTLGFNRRHPIVDALRVGAVADWLGVSPFLVGGSGYTGWELVIDPGLVGKLIAFARTAADDDEVMDEMTRIVHDAERRVVQLG